MRRSKFKWLLIALVFWVIYTLLSPFRHPYFNTLEFLIPMAVGILGLAIAVSFLKNLTLPFVLLVSLGAHLVAIGSFAFDHFFLKKLSGLSGLAHSIGSAAIIETFAVFPALSYAFLIFPLAVLFANKLGK